MADIIVPDDQGTIVAGIAAVSAPDDVVRIRTGDYTETAQAVSNVSGTAGTPCRIEPFGDGPVIWQRSGNFNLCALGAGANVANWTMRGLPTVNGSTFTIKGRFLCGQESSGYIANNFIWQDLAFANSYIVGAGAIWARYFRNWTIQDCSFTDIRSASAGNDGNAIEFWRGATATIQDCTFDDIGSDGIHAGLNASYEVQYLTIDDCTFEITHTRDGAWGNTGENGIDLKNVRYAVIRDSTFTGYRETVPGQDASGALGEAIVLHETGSGGPVTRDVLIERCKVDDCESAIWLAGNSTHLVDEVEVRNCLVHDMYNGGSYGVAFWVQYCGDLYLYHNTAHGCNENIRRGTGAATNGVMRNCVFVSGSWTGTGGEWVCNYDGFESTTPPTDFTGGNDVNGALGLGADFRPATGGAAVVDAGVGGLGVGDDLDGLARDTTPDIGCYEWAGGAPPTGDLHFRLSGELHASGLIGIRS